MKVRTAAVWGLMRAVHYDRLRRAHQHPRFGPMEAFIRRGEVRMLVGIGRKTRLSAAHFPYWSAQSYGMLTGQHELMVQEALRRSLPPDGVLIDVGCNIGALALVGAAIVGPGGRVIAIDPQRECVEATTVNAGLNGFDNVTVVHAAAAAQSGQTEVIITADSLWTRLADVGEHPLESRRDVVEAVSLDDLASRLNLKRVDAVKIDVEGAELEVVAGMHRMLAESKPIVVCEMHGKNAEFSSAMSTAGYRVINLDGPEPVEQADGNVHALCEPWPSDP